MNKSIVGAAVAAGIALAGCTPTQLATTSGAVAGGLIVAALGGTPAQIAAGAAVGGGTGWVVSQLTPIQGYGPGVCQAVNQFGQPIYVTRDGRFVTHRTPNPLLVSC
jgi:hypothetical protein